MNSIVTRELARRFRDQYGIVSRSQLHGLGVDAAVVRRRVASGEWEPLGSKIIRSATTRVTPQQQLLALCLAAGPAAMASHFSAAWLWGFADVPARHAIIVPRTSSARTPGGEVHRPTDFPAEVVTRMRVPCTNPLRTIADIAAIGSSDELEDVVDRALASRMVTCEAIEAELARTGRKGHPGTAALRSALRWRGPSDGANPSVLESRTLRLLRRAGIQPLSAEVKVTDDLSYRVDISLRPGLAIEVDGYAYHHSANQMTEDARRRNRLIVRGTIVLLYTWKDIAFEGHRVLAEVFRALSIPGRPGLSPAATYA